MSFLLKVLEFLRKNPSIPGRAGVAAFRGGLKLVREINELASEEKLAEARRRLDRIARSDHGKLRGIYEEYGDEMSPKVRRLFQEAMRNAE